MPDLPAGFEPTRAAGLARLESFAPRAGRAYQSNRNHDTGPDWPHVSCLSPWLHAGLLSEAETIEAALAEHGMSGAYKFVSEVFWRIYFKGYLEQRPGVWSDYCERRGAALAELDRNSGVKTAYSEAVEGHTGIEAFDVWARELVEHGFLHNHARMWFASIWCFTLKLDWTLGADFFLRHLMCADAASNTLNWRWVAGLHTRGKAYAATQANIARYTQRRPDGPLEAEGLARGFDALAEETPPGRVPLALPEPPAPQAFEGPYALLLHDEASHHETLDLPRPPALILTAPRPEARSPQPIGEPALRFAHGALESGGKAAASAFDCPLAAWTPDTTLPDLLAEAGVERVAVPFLPGGWTRDALWPELEPLSQSGGLVALVPDLSRATFPHAWAGFYGVRKRMEAVMQEVGLPA